jgi:hypothetical protein
MFFLIIFYLFTVVVMSAISIGAILIGLLPAWMGAARLGLMCGLFGALGGALYCVRAVYVNRSARNEWKPEWHCWYFLRPLASVICGGLSLLFLKAGLLVLDAGTKAGASHLGYYAFAFIAGFNVDKFLGKVEDIAQTTWGIEKSRLRASNEERKGGLVEDEESASSRTNA